LILTEREKQHLTEMERSCVFLETRKEMSTFDVIDLMREFGNVRVSKISPDGFWCQFVDIAADETAKSLIS